LSSFTNEELRSEFFGPGEPAPDATEFTQPNADFIEKTNRPPVAKQYEKKLRKVFGGLFRAAVANEATLPDAATILLHGPELAEKAGDLANVDKRVRRGIDMLTEGVENPYLAFAFAAAPLAIQLYRNHQEQINPKLVAQAFKARREVLANAPAAEMTGREIKIPFTKKTIRVRFRLSIPAVDTFTNDPQAMAEYVFTRPDIVSAMADQGIRNPYSTNGSGPS
jgi:hypothetical protein